MGSNYTKRYTSEFKRDAIALVDSTGRTVTEVARELGAARSVCVTGTARPRRAGARAGQASSRAPSVRSWGSCGRSLPSRQKRSRYCEKQRSSSRRRAIDERDVHVHRGGEDHPRCRLPVPAVERGPLLLLRLARVGETRDARKAADDALAHDHRRPCRVPSHLRVRGSMPNCDAWDGA
ncbi:transposase [Streptomyces sioyaensis]|uniref:transposase n=1 Tax=Streptomyces sioyaensis TaxID=67364 RepID=UPI0033D9E264